MQLASVTHSQNLETPVSFLAMGGTFSCTSDCVFVFSFNTLYKKESYFAKYSSVWGLNITSKIVAAFPQALGPGWGVAGAEGVFYS